MTIIVTVSGGKASAWCADWAIRTFPKKDVTLYFNDTKWEHPDLYRFLGDLETYFDHPIVNDSAGISPEELFYRHHAIANSRVPFCSRVLKAERLQAYYQDGDTLVFGIGSEEKHRAVRLLQVYQLISAKKNKRCTLRFPLIEEDTACNGVNNFIASTGIETPILYRLGFTHNNCSGGCVRAGKKHWKLLSQKLPEVYAERERMEEEFRSHFRKDVHILKDVTLKCYREGLQKGNDYGSQECADDIETECIGICNSLA